jgi:ParB-like chromosome segregation protein Spo0J
VDDPTQPNGPDPADRSDRGQQEVVDLLAIAERPQSRPGVAPPNLEPHPLAEIIPAMDESEFAELVADVNARGIMEPVVLYEGKILDGRHRYRAAREAGRSVDFTEYTGTDPLGYVVALNIRRRHLSASQKATIALVIEEEISKKAKVNMAEGGRVSQDRETLSAGPVHAAKKAAEIVGVSSGYVSDAKRIAASDPDLLQKVAAGETTIPKALETVKARRSEYHKGKRKIDSNRIVRVMAETYVNASTGHDLIDWETVDSEVAARAAADLREARTVIVRLIRQLEKAVN